MFIRTMGFLAVCGAILTAAPALAQKQKVTEADLAAAPVCAALPDGTDQMICQCPAGGSDGTVWGSGPYTADSDICTAARHAGVIGAEGGPLTLLRRPGQDAYEGSVRNGLTTREWGSYGDSFDVAAIGGKQVTLAKGGAVGCGAIPDGADVHDCFCSAGVGTGSVWGSGPYTADSDICTAARHAGVIGEGGGDVRVLRIGGLDRYRGSQAGDTTTSDWDAYGESIIFDRN